MQRTELPTGPWQDIAVDMMGPLPSGENILVAVGYYSYFYEVAIMQSTIATKVITELDEMFCRYIWISIQYQDRQWAPIQMSGL